MSDHDATPPELISPGFIHLRVHSAYSLLEGALPLAKVIGFAETNAMPAIGVADTANLFGALEFAQKAVGAGIQPIVGCQLDLVFDGELASPKSGNAKAPAAQSGEAVVLIAATEEGYANLVELVSQSYLSSSDGARAQIVPGWVRERSGGIICLTGGPRGPIGRMLADGHAGLAERRLELLKSLFGDRLYVELQRHKGYSRMVEQQGVELAYRHELPLVATNEAFFLKPEDYEAHDALIAIAEGTLISIDDRRQLTPDHWLKPAADMVALFADLPEAVENTVEIARRCSYFPQNRKPILPRFAAAAKDATPDEAVAAEAAELRRQAREGLDKRLAEQGMSDGYGRGDYDERLEYELGVIERMQFPGYFLIVADFIKWAKAQDIPVGPGRGSGAGSLVAWALTITDVDPLRFSLLFERFLNPDRVSMPDFDIDFCQERREEVIRYVQERYGREQVGQIITFGTLQARAVLRDVGRVLEMPYGQVDRLCKLVPNNPANPTPLAKAIEGEPKFEEEKQKEPIVGKLLDMALKLEGLYRHASTHAAGIVIGDRPLSRLVPMYRDPRSDMPVTQFNMKKVEDAGLVKFDFLGLKTLTVLKMAVNLVARKGIGIDLATIPLDDAPTYEMMSRGEVVGVFQVESAGMRKALIGMKPDRIEDIIALVALYRPGPMENIPTYNARKHGDEEVASIHPKIDHLVKETQGVIVYQEQVMQIAQELAGYTLGQADLLRRAMGKKIRAEMEKQRGIFVAGATERGVSKPQANNIFDLLAKFADYGFNKSHAAAYAIVSYQTAYMKAHHPVEFLAASMTYDMANADKLNDFRRDAIRLGIEVKPPSVQTSYRAFEVGENEIFYALAAIKGVGEAAVEHIVERRGDKPFDSLEDFAGRIDPRVVNRRTMEGLIAAGALDCFGHDRAALVAGLDRIMGLSQRAVETEESGQGDIFGASSAVEPERLYLPATEPWTMPEKLMREFQVLGFYFSAHPLDEYGPTLEKMRVQQYADFALAVKRGATAGRLAGTVASKQVRRTRTGNKMGIFVLSDATGQFEVVMFSETLALYEERMEPGQSVVLTVAAENREEGISLRANTVQRLDDEANKQNHALRIFVRDHVPAKSIAAHLKRKGDSPVSLIVIKEEGEGEVEIALPDTYQISPPIAGAIKAIGGVVDVELV
ncbi:DNA polymerase III subunit alpha [Oricola cellulosilytica]|uniref:DNA polymerase III subunit alpha n=1 Tax=Oricola cellulosilytica TaxID=1429082 RepID=A0A4R0PDF4_9HYPH|nr:DNA polymerase III subunit alpha [Oricola cellulosilytica]TCD14458.1 DNA polymerase III subunit alpha [Oricola cellulosilytica]